MPSPPLVSRPTEEPPSQGVRERQRVETRERIFQAALREFREVGFSAAQVDRIARTAGVVRGTFYFHFPTKDDVLLELARRISVRVGRRVAALRDTKPSLRQLLLRANDAIMDEHGRVGEAGLLGDMLALYMRRPADLDLAPAGTPTIAGELTHHLRSLADRGELRTKLPPEQLAGVLMFSLFGIYARVPPGEELRRTCEDLIDLLAQGMQACG